MANVFDTLKERGLVAQATDEEAIRDLLNKEKVTFYIGFDATADSLHVGHFLQLVVMRHLQKAGHRPIALLGGATTLIGDPTGRSDMRQMLTTEQIQHNADCFKRQMSKFVHFGDGDDEAMMVNNADWLLKLNYMDFLKDIGIHFSVNRMLATDAFKTRMERGLSFMEFNYMLLQSYDFLHLYRDYGCKMQFGGNDQWSNIISGVDLVRRKESAEVYGLTFTLLTTRDGKKMGKTESGAVWLDPEKTPPYDFFQYWRNIDDDDVQNCARLLTDIPLEDIDGLDTDDVGAVNKMKERLAYELTSVVHSQDDADKAIETARSLFAGGGSDADMPTTEIDADKLSDGGIGILELLVLCELTSSNGEGRRLIQQGGLSIDDERIEDPRTTIQQADLEKGITIQKGKKVHHRAILA